MQWVVEHKDGSPVDTAALARSVKSLPMPSGAVIRLEGVHRTADGLRAKCVAVNKNRGLDAGTPSPADRLIGPMEEVESSYVKFDVSPEPEPSAPKRPTGEWLWPNGHHLTIIRSRNMCCTFYRAQGLQIRL